jgi:four helix bundle protein
MQNYKDLKVWSTAHQFTLDVYQVTKSFPKEEVFGLTSQLQRAVSSIAANIAEGFGRSTQGDFTKFLQISLGPANEGEYFLILGNDLTYMAKSEFDNSYRQVNEIKAMLIALIQKVKNSKGSTPNECPST